MADEEQLDILRHGVDTWNLFRSSSPEIAIDLSGADLSGADLTNVDLHYADLRDADLSGANLYKTDLGLAILLGVNLRKARFNKTILTGAILRGTDLAGIDFGGVSLREADLREANLTGADLRRVDFTNADLTDANLTGANLTDADLTRAILVNTIVQKAKVSGSSVYGINVWDLQGEFAEQNDLVITPENAPIITVDDIKVAQFIYLILDNQKIRDVINTLTSKSVLILGRFSIGDRKAVLDALRDKLREYDLLPIVFDFDRPTDRDFTETVQTLAGLSLFTIVDVTNPKSTPLEMEATVKQFKIPYLPIIDLSADPRPYAMIVDSQNSFHWVLPTFGYKSKEELLDNIQDAIISRALEKLNELREQKATEQKILTVADLKKSRK